MNNALLASIVGDVFVVGIHFVLINCPLFIHFYHRQTINDGSQCSFLCYAVLSRGKQVANAWLPSDQDKTSCLEVERDGPQPFTLL